ncbi:MAG: cytochrome P450 [Actinomycetota bacterium]
MVAVEPRTEQQAPGPRGLPLVGSALDLLRDILGTTLKGMHEYGDVVRYVAGPPGPLRVTAFGIHDPESIQHVLASAAEDYSKQDATYIELRALVGNGLLTSEGDTWKRQKRLVQPLFTHKRVAGYADMMTAESAELAERWAAAGGSVDLHSEMTRFSLRVVCRALFGTDVEDMLPVLSRHVPYLSKRAFKRSLAPVSLPPDWHTPGNRRARRAKQEVYDIVDKLIAERRVRPTGEEDLLSLLLQAQDPDGGAPLDDDEVRDQALIFLLAGHETTATSLTFTLHLLGLHPDVQQRVLGEVQRVLGDRMPAIEDVRGLEYTTMVIKEAMRLYPAAYAIPRLAVKDDEISGYRIPAGSVAVSSPWVTHRHPKYWEEPEEFVPERFTAEREKARHRYAYFPFGGGPRACIGQHFSMMEAVIVTALLVRQYQFTAAKQEIKLFTGITLRPAEPVTSRIEPRQP